MKILLAAVNARFSHTNPAVRLLKLYADSHLKKLCDEKKIGSEHIPQIECGSWTINQSEHEVLRDIASSAAGAVLFSTYIWNASFISNIIPDVKKILPGCVIGAGGPEFSYGAQKYMKALPDLDFVFSGEGERSFLEFARKTGECENLRESLPGILRSTRGIFFRNEENPDTVNFSGAREPIENLDELPFAYPELSDAEKKSALEHRILYYESSRGCPFQCSYCLSSLDKSVRFKSLEKVFGELQIFLDAEVPLVKFVDRTYNINEERYIEIWRYILNHHNKKTMFHFEIEAEFLSENALEFLKTVPEGVMQFEMGIQSSNKKTLEAVHRSTDTEKLRKNIMKIPRTIHQHVDLIAGLPFEDLDSFGRSFDFAMKLKPDALQLGFLKVLPGTKMENFASSNGWKWMDHPVYEYFSTPFLSFSDTAFLKEIEILTDFYWNKKLFSNTLKYVFRFESPWKFFCALHGFAEKKGAFLQERRESYWFDIAADFFTEEKTRSPSKLCGLDFSVAGDLLRYDFVLSGKKGSFPAWYEHRYDKEKHRKLLDKHDLSKNSRIGFARTEYEEFDFDVEKDEPEKFPGKCGLLIKYESAE